jgi:hypothetical protein
MKNLFSLCLVLLMVTFPAAQDLINFDKGVVEMNFLLGYGYPLENNNSENPDNSFLLFSVIPAFVLSSGLSIEPEITYSAATDNSQSYLFFVPNLLFRFPPEIAGLYGRIGYNPAGAYSAFGVSIANNILNAGLGLLLKVSNETSLRMEINYKNIRSFNNISFLIGLNV